MPLVPLTAQEITISDKFDFFATTRQGIDVYLQHLSNDVADKVVIGSRDFEFLCGQEGRHYLMILIRSGVILRAEPKPCGDLEKADITEVLDLLIQLDSLR